MVETGFHVPKVKVVHYFFRKSLTFWVTGIDSVLNFVSSYLYITLHLHIILLNWIYSEILGLLLLQYNLIFPFLNCRFHIASIALQNYFLFDDSFIILGLVFPLVKKWEHTSSEPCHDDLHQPWVSLEFHSVLLPLVVRPRFIYSWVNFPSQFAIDFPIFFRDPVLLNSVESCSVVKSLDFNLIFEDGLGASFFVSVLVKVGL